MPQLRARCLTVAASSQPSFQQAFGSIMQQIQSNLQGLKQQAPRPGLVLSATNLTHQPPGASAPLLQSPTDGSIVFTPSSAPQTGSLSGPPAAEGSLARQRRSHVGMLFQFPERHFLGVDIIEELTFAWPQQNMAARQALATSLAPVLQATKLEGVPLRQPLSTLSGGQQRRVALAVAIARKPAVLLLDEPLAGLDWRARAEVASVLRDLKKECTMLVVSHDLKELAPLVDCAWEMRRGWTGWMQ
ncbi:hypothetical protein WJX73_008084 [Symbiochloris irregularis]|uniref:ABC transporter domain-containing protein n=1 Tax=Symbiochloris irregularis TaxID=706552 RepID=A0AAW1Q2T4_9CHLO